MWTPSTAELYLELTLVVSVIQEWNNQVRVSLTKCTVNTWQTFSYCCCYICIPPPYRFYFNNFVWRYCYIKIHLLQPYYVASPGSHLMTIVKDQVLVVKGTDEVEPVDDMKATWHTLMRIEVMTRDLVVKSEKLAVHEMLPMIFLTAHEHVRSHSSLTKLKSDHGLVFLQVGGLPFISRM